MPELPEVETIRRDLQQRILSKTIKSVRINDPFVLRTPSKHFISSLEHQSIKAVERRGKALLIELSNSKYLQVQLMMTGQLVIDGAPDKHSHVVISFKDGTKLLYNDQRKFGQLRILKSLSESKHISSLGPEPFGKDFSADYILKKTRHSKRPIKNLLLDHTFVAGIGNIYACEILFRCGINPKHLSGKITQAQSEKIYQNSIAVLSEAIKNRGSSMRNYRDASGEQGQFKRLIKVYAREDQPCLKCKNLIQRIVQAGRSTFYCPKCQK